MRRTQPTHVAAARVGLAAPTSSGSVEMRVASLDSPSTVYRVRSTSTGEIVEISTDSGVHWTPVLAPTPAQPETPRRLGLVGSAPTCLPANYGHVNTLAALGTGAGTLFVGTMGTPGNYLDGGCSSADGGLYASIGGQAAIRLGTDGLPYAQDPVGRTVRAYDIDVVTADPRNPGSIYVHAAQGTGPDSPPAGLYRSTDGGGHWVEIDNGLRPSTTITNAAGIEVPVYDAGALTIDQGNASTLTFSNDTGVYSSTNGGDSWGSPGAGAAFASAATPTAPPTPVLAAAGGLPAQPQRLASTVPLPSGWVWSQLSPITAPPPGRQDAAMAWDATDRLALVFGGVDSSGAHPLRDLWAYSPATNGWIARAIGPSARFGASAAWDPADRILLVYGGQTGLGSGAIYSGDLWAYRPATDSWTVLSTSGAPNSPAPRSHAVTVWDESANRFLVFSGEVSESPFQGTNDLWSFTPTGGGSGGFWTKLNANNSACTVTCPLPRFGSEGAWDSGAGVLRVFGGQNAAQSVLSDSWNWVPSGNSGAWVVENSPTQPAGRAYSAVAYDGLHGAVVVGPGLSLANGNMNDAWANLPNQGGWQPLPIAASPAPPTRHLAQWVWDDADSEYLLFGGRVPGTSGANDLWALAPTGPVPTPTAQPTSPVSAGLDEGWAVDNNQNPLVTPGQIASTTNVGARIVRVNFRLGSATDWSNSALLAAYDTIVNNYLAAGLQVEGLITNEATHGSQSDWTANNREVSGGNGENPYITTAYIQDAVKPILTHFSNRVTVWELWNEPNAYQSCNGAACSGGSFIYPSNLAALLVDSYMAIKDPVPFGMGLSGMTIVSGGLLGHSIGGALTSTNAGATYLKNTFTMGVNTVGSWAAFASTHGGRYPLDGIGQHLYVDQNLLTTTTDLATYYGWVRGAAAAFETPQPTYLTEGAWSTALLPQGIQATNLDLLFGASRATGYISAMTWFELQDVPQNNLYFGLTDSNLTPKQAYAHYQAQAGTAPPPATSTATVTPTSTPTGTASTTGTPTTTTTGGSLVGSAILPPSRVNLTSEGTTDWADWGLTTPSSFDHKANVGSQISTFSNLAGGALSQSTLPAIFSWTDGTPDVASTGTSSAVSLKGNGQGFGLTLPADLIARTVHLYVAVSSGQANLTASLSDGSAPPYSDSSMASFFGNRMQEYTLTYHAASPGQSLQIAFTLLNNYGAGTISLAAASLSGGGPPATTATGTSTVTATTTPAPPSSTPTATNTAGGSTATSTATATASKTPVPVSSTSTPSATNTPGTIPATGSLVGSAILPPSRVNLTSEGTADWADWGFTSPTSFDHKASGGSQIPTFNNLAGGTLGQTTLPAIFSWTDGTPDAASTGTSTAVSLKGNGQGFGLTLPADLTSRTVHLYVAVSSGQANLTASLSDGSAPPYSDSSMASFFGNRMQEYTLTYQAAASGQSLNIRFTLLNNYGAGTISLAAASLAGGGPPAATSTATATATTGGSGATSTNTATATTTETPVPGTATGTPTTITATGGSLVGSAILPPSRINLTTEGIRDWAHWGLAAPNSFDHKANVVSQIPTFSNLAGGTLGQTTLPSIFSWTDGTPDAASTGTSNAVSLKGNGQGFGLTLPADLTARTVHLYVAVSSGQANLTASLSDGSAPAYSDSSMASFFGNRMQEYTLTYRAGLPGQSLHLTFTLLNNYGAGTLSLAAATVS
ncbi:MAG TPA: kelch repeat-containing protein [Chloroflexota bacterium]|nr:kelch repeat-containing protein [Chloroflexota bacterium]